jgi:hypothetical protein
MREDSNISERRAALRRQGVWGSRAERLLHEWGDHVQDDIAHRVESGVDPAEAEAAARHALGTPADLATHAARELAAGLWLGRHPWVAGLAIPVLVWLLTVAALLFGGLWLCGLLAEPDARHVSLTMVEGWQRIFNWLPWLLSMSWLAWMAGRMPGGWKLFWVTTVVLTLCSTAIHLHVKPPLNGPGSGSVEMDASGPGGFLFDGTVRLLGGPGARGPEPMQWLGPLHWSMAWFQSALLFVGGLMLRLWATKSRPHPGQVA